MFRLLLFICLLGFIPNVHTECSLKSSKSWLCDGRQMYRNRSSFDYLSVLKNQQPEKMILINYNLSVLNLENYPGSLRIFNASNNRIRSIKISSKDRQSSNLRHLILQSNGIEQFDIDTIVLPHSLQTISLANNRLKILDARLFSHLENLITLDLSRNRLKRVLPQLLLSIDVQLNNNPLECQCTPEPYRSVCEKATSLKTKTVSESNNCMAPYYNPRPFAPQQPPYLRFSTFVLVCPISGNPPPVIVWSTPFGNLTAVNSSNVDLLSSVDDEPLYVTLTALAGPLTARTKHTLHAFDVNHLSVTEARAALQNRISCFGINMLGTYTYEFDFGIRSFVGDRAVWQLIYTAGFGLFMALVAGALCVTLKRTSYYQADHLKTPPIYPTMTPNSASRTPPNFELNQWLSLAAANISGTLEQVRDKLRLGVQQVSEHMGQTMGRATVLLTHGVQHAGGTIRQAAETSAAYLHSIRESSQHRLNTMRVQTLSSIRNPGSLMRAGMNMLTTQVNSLRDYCGVTTGNPLPQNYYSQQQQHSPSNSNRLHNQITTIMEEDESIVESASLMGAMYRSPYVGHTASTVLVNTSGIGRLDRADNSALSILNTFNRQTGNLHENAEITARGQMSAGIGTFHGRPHDDDDDLIDERERLTIYGEQRPVC